METESQLCARYEAELASIAAVDRRYYLSPCPTLAERQDYAARQLQLEEIRSCFYVDLNACRLNHLYMRQFRRCRSMVRRSHPSTVRSA